MVINKNCQSSLNCGVHNFCDICRCSCNKFYVINDKTLDFGQHFKILKRIRRKTSDKINRGINCVRQMLRPAVPTCPTCSGLCQTINNSDCFISKRFSDAFVTKVNAQSEVGLHKKSKSMPRFCQQEDYDPRYEKFENGSPYIIQKKSFFHEFLIKLCGVKKDRDCSQIQTANRPPRKKNTGTFISLKSNKYGVPLDECNTYDHDYYCCCYCCPCNHKLEIRGAQTEECYPKRKVCYTKTEPIKCRCCKCCNNNNRSSRSAPLNLKNSHHKPRNRINSVKSATTQVDNNFYEHYNKQIFLSPVSGRKYNFDPPCHDEKTHFLDSVWSTIQQINQRKLEESVDKTLSDINDNPKFMSLSPRLSQILAKYSIEDLEMAVTNLEEERQFVSVRKIESHDLNIDEARKLIEKVRKEKSSNCNCPEFSSSADDSNKINLSSAESDKLL